MNEKTFAKKLNKNINYEDNEFYIKHYLISN